MTGIASCNIALGGPIENGRDQTGAFNPSSWVHLYAIWGTGKPTSPFDTIFSASSMAPTLPAGYTHWAYILPIFLDSLTHLSGIRVFGNKASYAPSRAVLTNGTATVETQIASTSYVPPNARSWTIGINNHPVSGVVRTCAIRVLSATAYITLPVAGGSVDPGGYFSQLVIPNLGLYYQFTSGAGLLDITALGYEFEN